jgi:hypothetical protein
MLRTYGDGARHRSREMAQPLRQLTQSGVLHHLRKRCISLRLLVAALALLGLSVASRRGMKRIFGLLLLLFLALAVTLGVMRIRGAAVKSGSLPEIVSFTVTPRVISRGEFAIVAWDIRGVPTVTIESGPESHPRGSMRRQSGLPAVGKMTVRPEEDTVYVLECETEYGQTCVSASATVRVK